MPELRRRRPQVDPYRIHHFGDGTLVAELSGVRTTNIPIDRGTRPARADVEAVEPVRPQRGKLAKGTTPPPIPIDTAANATSTFEPPSITDGIPLVVLDD
jgi:hypothetical protein